MSGLGVLLGFLVGAAVVTALVAVGLTALVAVLASGLLPLSGSPVSLSSFVGGLVALIVGLVLLGWLGA